jgi:hypothetical protein
MPYEKNLGKILGDFFEGNWKKMLDFGKIFTED